jgi:hypothetical protein
MYEAAMRKNVLGIGMVLFFSSLAAMGCSGSKTICETTSCATGGMTYKACADESTSSYELGSQSCSCINTDATCLSNCAAEVAAYCGGGGTGDLFCSTSSGCLGFKNLTAAQKTAETTACAQQSGTAVSACPSAGLVGCCTQTSSGVTAEICYYAGTVSDLMTSCASASGTWSATQ